MNEEQQYQQAFGEQTGLTWGCRSKINIIRNNDPNYTEFILDSRNADQFTDQAWTLLGRYIANNTHLKKINLGNCLDDEQVELLFGGLTKSVSLERLELNDNDFGIVGVRSMIPFLQNSPNLSIIFCGNSIFDTECFEVLVSALNGKSIKELYFYGCNITDVSALETCNLPNLQTLDLDRNKIGRAGCITISNLLQKEGSTLTRLYLNLTGMGDEEAEFLANSLKHNTKLKELHLQGRGIGLNGYTAFLKLLVDMSSTKSIYTSNHTLERCELSEYEDDHPYDEVQTLINTACEVNKNIPTSHAAGRAKVIKYQLNSINRKNLCRLQDVEYCSILSLQVLSLISYLADIDPILLPDILILIGREHGNNELINALLSYNVDAKNKRGKKRRRSDM